MGQPSGLILNHATTHFSSLVKSSLAKTPTMRMTIISSNVSPRRKSSCWTDRTFPTVVVVDLFWPGTLGSWGVLPSSELSQWKVAVQTSYGFWSESEGLREKLQFYQNNVTQRSIIKCVRTYLDFLSSPPPFLLWSGLLISQEPDEKSSQRVLKA